MKKLLSIIILIILVIALSGCGENDQPCDHTVRVILTDDTEFIYEDVCYFGIIDLAFIKEDVFMIKMNKRNQYGESVTYPIELIKSIGYINKVNGEE